MMNEGASKPCCSCTLGNCTSCRCSKSPGGCTDSCKSKACLGRRANALAAKQEPSPAKPVGGPDGGKPRRGADRGARRAGSGSWDEAQEQKAFDAQMDEIEGKGGSCMADAGFKTLRTPCSCPCCDTLLESDEAALEHFRTEAHSSKMSTNLDELGDQIPEDVRSELRATVMYVRPVTLTGPVHAFSRLRQAFAAKTALNASAPPDHASSHGSTASPPKTRSLQNHPPRSRSETLQTTQGPRQHPRETTPRPSLLRGRRDRPRAHHLPRSPRWANPRPFPPRCLNPFRHLSPPHVARDQGKTTTEWDPQQPKGRTTSRRRQRRGDCWKKPWLEPPQQRPKTEPGYLRHLHPPS